MITLSLCRGVTLVIRKRLPTRRPAMAFVTTAVTDWTPVFADERYARLIIQQLHRTVSHHQLSLAAYVVIPSHVHLLLGFKEIEKLSKVVQQFKSLSTRLLLPLLPLKLIAAFHHSGHFQLWRPRFDDVIIWSEKQFRIKVKYIHRNPVKAGLARTATDYTYSSARVWLLHEPGLIPVDKEWTWLEDDKG